MLTYNDVTIFGCLGRDPEQRQTSNGKTLVSLAVATNMGSYGDVKKVQWHNVTIMVDALAQLAINNLKKGSYVLIKGHIEQNKYTDKSGQEKISHEIIVGVTGALRLISNDEKPAAAPVQRATPQTRPAVRKSISATIAENVARNVPDDDIPW